MSQVITRTQADRCPGVFRPWIADDGAILRLRIPGGRVSASALRALAGIAGQYGDGTILLTKRANLQVRGIAATDGAVCDGLVSALRAAGLLPTESHELVRNIVCSPLTGRIGGRGDLRPVVTALDAALCEDPDLTGLGGRFLFVLDDGRGDVAGRPLDLGLVAVDAASAQLRIGSHSWGEVVPLAEAVPALVRLAGAFLRVRGHGDSAWWHVDELPDPSTLAPSSARDDRTEVTADPVGAGRHTQVDGRRLEVVEVPDGILTAEITDRLLDHPVSEYVVTPWRSVLVPDLEAG